MNTKENNNDTDEKLTHEERLQALAYEFLALYERWSEDRQIAAKQGADTAELVKVFTEQVKQFKLLAPDVREQIKASVREAVAGAATTICDETSKEIARASREITGDLTNAASEASHTLRHYQQEIKWNVFGAMCITALASIVVSVLIFWCFTPKPVSPLTHHQIGMLEGGRMMDLVWPKLSKTEQQHWLKFADEVLQQQEKEIKSG